jgi:MFS family permease
VVSRERRPLYVLLAASAASLLGNVVAAVAIPWFVLATTGSAARTGLAAFFTTLPLALGALFGGAVADRIGARRASVLGDLLSAASVAGIPLLFVTGQLEFWHVLALGFVSSLFDGPSQAARQALIPELAERAAIPLERANSLYKGTEHFGYVVGAPLAGGLIATIGAPAALWVDAASFLLSALAIAVAVPAVRPALARGQSYLRDLLDGLSFVAREPLIRAFLVLPMVGNFFISPLAPVVLPIYARRELGGAGDFAAMMGSYGVGGLLGVLLFGAVGNRLPRRRVYVLLALVYPVVSLALIPMPPLAIAVAALALIGVVAGAGTPLYYTVRQERTPPELRGRVFATVAAAEASAIPLGVLFAAYVIEVLGLRAAFVAFAAGNILYAVLKLTLPGTRELEQPATSARASRAGSRARQRHRARLGRPGPPAAR